MRKALLVEGPSSSKSLARWLEDAPFEIERFSTKARISPEVLVRDVSNPEFVLVDLKTPLSEGRWNVVVQLKKRDVPVLFAGDDASWQRCEKHLQEFTYDPRVDWLRMPASETEFRFRINRITAPKLPPWTDLRSSTSGRIDARLVAKYLGWNLTALSQAVGRSVKAVHKTPDAPALQKHLELFEKSIIFGRRLVSQDPGTFRKWLNTPTHDLDDARPGDLLRTKPDVVLGLLEDAALGHPS